MSIRGSNFENQHPFASDHALVWERCMPDGLLYGVDMSFTSTLFTLGTGFMLVAGRMFEITAAESISISPGSGYARVYVAIDTGGAATENSFDQVSFGVDYAANLDSFAELTQGEININQGAAVYQAEVAVLAINSSGVTAIERQMELVSPGAGTDAFAAIAVTYPAGSTVTVTDGKITYTAPNTSGTALFIIPYAATWIVSATDGTETASETVEILTEGQSVSVELSFKLWLFKSGEGAITSLVTATSDTSKPTAIIISAESITLTGATSYGGRGVSSDEMIDLSSYTKICVDCVKTSTSGAVGEFCGIGLTKIQSIEDDYDSTGYRNRAAFVEFPASRSVVSIDVSAFTEAYYVYLGGTDTATVYNWWLE